MSEANETKAESLKLPAGIIDQAIAFLEVLAVTTFTAIDDVAVRFLRWAIEQPEFKSWWDKLRTPSPSAENFISNLQGDDEAALLVMADKFMAANAIPGDPTAWINIVFQILAAIKAFRDKRKQPAANA